MVHNIVTSLLDSLECLPIPFIRLESQIKCYVAANGHTIP